MKIIKVNGKYVIATNNHKFFENGKWIDKKEDVWWKNTIIGRLAHPRNAETDYR